MQKKFAGPYEMYSANPILYENEKWKCMGHGTFVKGPGGTNLYLHHAYNKQSTVFTGRQGLISELVWPQKNGWPVFKAQNIWSAAASDIHDKFASPSIAKYWQWDFRNSSPVVKQQKGVMHLSGTVKLANQTGIVLTARPVSGNFAMVATVINNNTALKGLTFYGDANVALGIGTQNNEIILWQVKDNKFSALAQSTLNTQTAVQLKLELTTNNTCKFYYRQGKMEWKELTSETPLKADFLPQWDRSPRAGLHFKGDSNQEALFF